MNEIVHGVEKRTKQLKHQHRKDILSEGSNKYLKVCKVEGTVIIEKPSHGVARGCHCHPCFEKKKKGKKKEAERTSATNTRSLKKKKGKGKKRQATNSKPPWNLQQSSGPQGSWSSIRVAISSLYGVESSRKGLKGLGGGQETDSRLPSAAHAPLPRCLHTRTRG